MENSNNDEKSQLIANEASKCLTWVHVLNYQKKLQFISSMHNLNGLKNGLNRFKFSEFYTIGQSLILPCNSHASISIRQYELNNYLKNSLPLYKLDAQAPPLISEYFELCTRKCETFRNASLSDAIKKTFYVRRFEQYLSNCLKRNSPQEKESFSTNNSRINNFYYLQKWPPNFDYFFNEMATP